MICRSSHKDVFEYTITKKYATDDFTDEAKILKNNMNKFRNDGGIELVEGYFQTSKKI